MDRPIPADLLTSICEFRSDRKTCEIEVRLGVYTDSKFFSGVSKQVFDQLDRDLQDSPSLGTDNKWSEIVDYHYVTQRDEPARTRVEYNTDHMTLTTTHILKQTQHEVVYRMTEDDDDAFKINHSTEVPLENAPNMCIPTFVRIKQRKKFEDVRECNLVWSYELSKTWSANSRSAVEHLQLVSEPRYEVELELVDHDGSYSRSLTDTDIALSLMLKATMLMGETSTSSLIHEGSFPPRSRNTSAKRKRRKTK